MTVAHDEFEIKKIQPPNEAGKTQENKQSLQWPSLVYADQETDRPSQKAIDHRESRANTEDNSQHKWQFWGARVRE